jgi:1-phosphofructokinase
MPSLILALNPSIDAEWRVEDVQWQEKNVVLAERRWAGGKGVNVARWLQHLGEHPRLLIPLGGATGNELARQLRAERLKVRIIALRQATRVNVIVTTARGRQLRFNPLGPKLAPDEWRKIFDAIRRDLSSSSCLILSGSLPRAASVQTYTRLVRIGRQAGCKSVLDCDGASFTAAVRAKPFLVKPNDHELAQWRGRVLASDEAVFQAACELSSSTEGWVLVSRGERGAVLVNAPERIAFTTRPPRSEAVNTVGAGDAMLAAAARQIEQNASPQEWLRWGVATGTAATQCLAGELPKLGLIRSLAGKIKVKRRMQ